MTITEQSVTLSSLLKALRSDPNDRVTRLALADLYEESGEQERAREQRAAVELMDRYPNLDHIKCANFNAELHWFSDDTMRFFKCRVSEQLFYGFDGVYFVSSEVPFFGGREYTVRVFLPDGRVTKQSDLGKFKTLSSALNAARRTAAESPS